MIVTSSPYPKRTFFWLAGFAFVAAIICISLRLDWRQLQQQTASAGAVAQVASMKSAAIEHLAATATAENMFETDNKLQASQGINFKLAVTAEESSKSERTRGSQIYLEHFHFQSEVVQSDTFTDNNISRVFQSPPHKDINLSLAQRIIRTVHVPELMMSKKSDILSNADLASIARCDIHKNEDLQDGELEGPRGYLSGVSTALECCKSCMELTECWGFSHHSAKGTCLLKSSHSERLQASPDHYSGVVTSRQSLLVHGSWGSPIHRNSSVRFDPLDCGGTYNRSGRPSCISVYITGDFQGGFGNRLLGLAYWLAVVKAAGRVAAVSKRHLWEDFYTPDYTTRGIPVGSDCIVCAGGPHMLSEECCNAMFARPHAAICVRMSGHYDLLGLDRRHRNLNRTDFLHTRAGECWPDFYDSYVREIKAQDGTDPELLSLSSALIAAAEIPRILAHVTDAFRREIAMFEEEMQLGDTSITHIPLSLHIRTCQDCGWVMKDDSIRHNLHCVLEGLANAGIGFSSSSSSSTATKIVFVTSDSRSVLHLISSVLPSSLRLVERIPKTMIHSAKTMDAPFTVRARPFIDHYLLGNTNLVYSCFTSYGMTAVLRNGGLKKLKDGSVQLWQHHDEHVNPRGNCHPCTFADCNSLRSDN